MNCYETISIADLLIGLGIGVAICLVYSLICEFLRLN